MVVPNNPWPGYVTSRTGGQVAWWKETRNTNRESHGGRWGSQPERQQISTIHTWSYKKRGFNPNPVRRKKTGCVCLCSSVSILNESGSLCALLVLWTQTEKIRESSEGAGRRSAPGPTPERCAPDWNAAQCRNLEKWVIHLLPVRVLRALPARHKTLLRKKESPTASCPLFSCSSRSRDAFKSRGAWRRLAAGVWALLQRASRVFEVTSCGGPVYLSSRSPPHSLSSFFSFLFVLSPSLKEDVPPLHPRFHHPHRRYNLTWWGLCSLGIKTWRRELVFWRGIWWSRISWRIHPFNPIFSWKSDVHRE